MGRPGYKGTVLCATLKNWEWPGDEAKLTSIPLCTTINSVNKRREQAALWMITMSTLKLKMTLKIRTKKVNL